MIKLGTKTKYGIVSAILYIGERYYLLKSKEVTKLLPADILEKK